MIISRKEFLKTSALALSIPLLGKVDAFAKPLKDVRLQIYTLRNELSKDPEGTLKKAADIGYKEVETFGYAGGKFFGKTPGEFKSLLSGLGLTTPSGHYMPNNLKKDWNLVVDRWPIGPGRRTPAGQIRVEIHRQSECRIRWRTEATS